MSAMPPCSGFTRPVGESLPAANRPCARELVDHPERPPRPEGPMPQRRTTSESAPSWPDLPATARVRLLSTAAAAVVVALACLLFQLDEPVAVGLLALWLVPLAARYWWLQAGRWHGTWSLLLLDLVAVIVSGNFEVIAHPSAASRMLLVAVIGILVASATTLVARFEPADRR